MKFNYWQTFYEGSFYHVYNRSVGHEQLFANDDNYTYFLKKWQKYLHPYVDTYAYCLMGNHFHFLMRVKPITDDVRLVIQAENTVASERFCAGEITLNGFLEDQFKRYFSAYSLAYNKQHKRHGALFQERFKRVEIIDDVRLLDALCYIHHNPIHHDYSPSYDGWQYSSYIAYLSDKPTLLVRQKGLALFDGVGTDSKAFEAYHEAFKIGKRLWKKPPSWEDDLMEGDK
jgi:putative transposase